MATACSKAPAGCAHWTSLLARKVRLPLYLRLSAREICDFFAVANLRTRTKNRLPRGGRRPGERLVGVARVRSSRSWQECPLTDDMLQIVPVCHVLPPQRDLEALVARQIGAVGEARIEGAEGGNILVPDMAATGLPVPRIGRALSAEL